jgi:hypothetical protein
MVGEARRSGPLGVTVAAMAADTPEQDIRQQAEEQKDQVLQREGLEKELMEEDRSEVGERLDDVE